MKTIDVKTLVQLNPDVVPVGNRPSPGVFEYGQGGAGLPSISCAGATSSAIFAMLTKDNVTLPMFDYIENSIKVNGQEMLDPQGYFKTSDVATILTAAPAGWSWTLPAGKVENISTDYLRMEVKSVPDLPAEYMDAIQFVMLDNPTAHQISAFHSTVCFAPFQFQFICTPADAQTTVELFKARDSLPFLTFANVVFNISENGVQIASEKSLLDVTAMESIGLEVVSVNETNRLIRISSMDGVNNRALELHPTMNIVDDVDITHGEVLKHDGSFFICLAKKPT